jgi:hypothetical protein
VDKGIIEHNHLMIVLHNYRNDIQETYSKSVDPETAQIKSELSRTTQDLIVLKQQNEQWV